MRRFPKIANVPKMPKKYVEYALIGDYGFVFSRDIRDWQTSRKKVLREKNNAIIKQRNKQKKNGNRNKMRKS
jgi:hypothetical protein